MLVLPPATVARLAITRAVQETFAGRATQHVSVHATEIAAAAYHAVEALAVASAPPQPTPADDCTHGADCPVHRDAQGIHDRAATPSELLTFLHQLIDQRGGVLMRDDLLQAARYLEVPS